MSDPVIDPVAQPNEYQALLLRYLGDQDPADVQAQTPDIVAGLVEAARQLGLDTMVGAADAVQRSTPYFAWRPVFRQLLGLTPASKIVYSSDASQIPEPFWLAARWGRRGLGVVLDELVAAGALSQDEALRSARQILGGNAARVYGVAWG